MKRIQLILNQITPYYEVRDKSSTVLGQGRTHYKIFIYFYVDKVLRLSPVDATVQLIPGQLTI